MSEPIDPHAEEPLGKAYDARLMRRLLGYLAPHRALAFAALGLMLLSSAAQLVGPLATATAIDLFLAPALGVEGARSGVSEWVSGGLSAAGLAPSPLAGVLGAAGVYFVSLLVAFVTLTQQAYLLQTLGQRVMADLRRDVFAHLQRLEVAYFDRTPVGRLVTRVTSDVDALNELFASGIVSIVGDLLLLLGIAGVLLALDWRLALAAFAVLPLLGLLTFWFKTRARRSFREVRGAVARMNAFLQEHLSGMSVVQLYGREPVARAAFREINAEHRDANIRGIHYYAVYFPGVEILTALGLAAILLIGGGEALAGTLSVGALVAFLQYVQRFYQPLADLSERYNVLQQAMASSERIFLLLDREPAIVSPEGGIDRRGSGARSSSTGSSSPTGRASRCCTTSPSGSRRARRSRWSARPAPARRRSRISCSASTRSRRARCGWTASTSARGTSRRCARRRRSSFRTSSSSPATSRAISPSASRRSLRSGCARPRPRRRRSTSSSDSPTASPRRSRSAARGSRSGRSSSSPSPAPSPSIRAS